MTDRARHSAAAPSGGEAAAGGQPAALPLGDWPHLRGKAATGRIMWSVAACLVPAAVAAAYFFGVRAYLHIGLAVATAVAAEAAIQRLRRVPVTVGDGSAVVTGLLIALCLPPQARWFVPVVASLAAVGIAKQCFGGLGYNIWNPALVGRALVQVAFPTDLDPSKYSVLTGGHFTADLGAATARLPDDIAAVTSATPLAEMKRFITRGVDFDAPAREIFGQFPGLGDMLTGNHGGALGETCALALLAGAAYLIIRGWVRWQIPLVMLVTVALGAVLLPIRLTTPEDSVWRPAFMMLGGTDMALHGAAYHLLSGGLILGAFFMATDPVTSPMTPRGMLLFGAGGGLLTIVIRLYGGYPEAVCYAILLMNTAVPLIDRFTQRRIFGHTR